MDYREVKTNAEALDVFPLLRQLREHLNEQVYLRTLRAAQEESGYRLLALYDGGRPVGLMGYRVLTDFVHGRHLYIDDLVTDENRRSQGLGAQLLEKAKAIASQEGCARLRLCTGVANRRGGSFYERNGWDLRAVVYKTKIKTNSV